MTTSKTQPLLRHQLTSENERRRHNVIRQQPLKILQIGEGNFLRGFADWMIHEMNASGKYHGSVVLTPPTPRGAPKLDKLAEQEGLYTLVQQGLQHGEKVEKRQLISVFREYVNPYGDWEAFLRLAELESLDVVISNTTEAGLTYVELDYVPGEPIVNYPARLTVFLQRRFATFGANPQRGLMILPCELVENNGDLLKSYVLRYAQAFGFGDDFCQWVEQHQLFLNNLVDRIVTGMPQPEEYARLTEGWGYEDHFLTSAEPYYIWIIEGSPSLDQRLPLVQTGLNVKWTHDLQPYRQRKVHILNGAHTLMMPIGLLHHIHTVRELMHNERFGNWVKQTIAEEVIPSLSLPAAELQQYAEETYERFYNPYLEHRLLDIAMNSLSKFQARILPVLKTYTKINGQLPPQLVRSFAALLLLYRVQPIEHEGSTVFRSLTLDGQPLDIRDNGEWLQYIAHHWNESQSTAKPDGQPITTNAVAINRILSDTRIWGEDLTVIPGLAQQVTMNLNELEAERR
ncbi:tagaturonate reductase [Paenibacillus campi]|uniref:tagaturonate reductase n=1 Tax=Paenibacillus campi TaxID=3106031 RepID=UPI002AFF71C8|nr:tagaturonate reductase [Paenibacillus sp. SGZ-1009]